MIEKVANSEKAALRWFYVINGSSAGPVTTDGLRDLLHRGTLSHQTLVWNQTFGQEWKQIRETEIAARGASPPPLPPKATLNKNRRPIGALAALPAAILSTTVLPAVGVLSLRMCFYLSIIIAVASAVCLVKPIPKILLTRIACFFVLSVASISAVASNRLLQWADQQLREDCQRANDKNRIIASCTLIIQDKSENAERRARAYLHRGATYHERGYDNTASADYREALRLPLGNNTLREELEKAEIVSLKAELKAKGLSPERLRFSVAGPTLDLSFIDAAWKRFAVQQTFFLYVWEPAGNRVEVANAGARLVLAPGPSDFRH